MYMSIFNRKEIAHRCWRTPNAAPRVCCLRREINSGFQRRYIRNTLETLFFMNTGIAHFYFSPSGNNLCLSQRDTAHLIIITNLVAFSLSIPLRLKIWKYRELKHKCHFQGSLSILRHHSWAGARDRNLSCIIHLRNQSPKSTWWMPAYVLNSVYKWMLLNSYHFIELVWRVRDL